VRTAKNAFGTNPHCLETRHAGFDAEFFGEPVDRDDNAVTAPPAADPHRPFLQFGIQRHFTTGEEAVGVNMQYAVAAAHARQTI
jgi:hypothetical protein